MLKPFLLTLEYPPDIGGLAKYLEGEVKNFAGKVEVVKAQPMMWILRPKWLPILWRARGQFRRAPCDGLWVSHVLPIGYAALVWKLLFKTPYRLYVHGLDLVRPQRSIWKKFWAKRILSAADEIVANSNATARLLTNYGLNPARARVQYPRLDEIDGSAYYKTGIRLRRQYNINDQPLLLTISRLVKRKGIDLVLQALPAIWKTIPDLVYVIVGDGEDAERLKNFPLLPEEVGEKQNLTDRRVIFVGSVSDEAKYGWLAAADCFILTPIDDPNDFEGYGIVYKEAQSFGKPVIGSGVGGVPEAVGDNGVLVEPGNVEEIADAIINQISPLLSKERVG